MTTAQFGVILNQPARIAATAAIASIPPITMLLMESTAPVDPIWTLSDYVVSRPDGIALFAMTAAALAIGGVALAHGLRLLSNTRVIRTLLMVWSIAVITAAAFPTNVVGTPAGISANVHLIAGGVLFAVLPIAGYLLARNLHRTLGHLTAIVLVATSAVSGLLDIVIIFNRLPTVIGMSLMLPPGILQRVAGGIQIVLLAVSAITVRHYVKAEYGSNESSTEGSTVNYSNNREQELLQ